MKKLIYTLNILLVLLLFNSCEEVIEIDLNDSDPTFVAKANINQGEPCMVHLTLTSNYFSDEEPGIIENAKVTIRNESFSEELIYLSNGNYSGSLIFGEEETNYSIEISVNGENYVGESYMPKHTEIYELNCVESDFARDGESYQIECKFRDNPGVEEFYMIRYTLNGEILNNVYNLSPDFLAMNDTITNVGRTIFFKPGDKVGVKVYSIDEELYNYFTQLNDAVGGGSPIMSSTPYNPKSNISNGAMGYFAAWSYSEDSITIIQND